MNVIEREYSLTAAAEREGLCHVQEKLRYIWCDVYPCNELYVNAVLPCGMTKTFGGFQSVLPLFLFFSSRDVTVARAT